MKIDELRLIACLKSLQDFQEEHEPWRNSRVKVEFFLEGKEVWIRAYLCGLHVKFKPDFEDSTPLGMQIYNQYVKLYEELKDERYPV